MTIAELLQAAVKDSPVQMLHECLLGARTVNGRGSQGRRKGHEPYTRVEFATVNMTPNDAMYWAGGMGRPDSRKPRYVGLVVWVPFETYESATSVAAVDPVAASQQPTSTRD